MATDKEALDENNGHIVVSGHKVYVKKGLPTTVEKLLMEGDKTKTSVPVVGYTKVKDTDGKEHDYVVVKLAKDSYGIVDDTHHLRAFPKGKAAEGQTKSLRAFISGPKAASVPRGGNPEAQLANIRTALKDANDKLASYENGSIKVTANTMAVLRAIEAVTGESPSSIIDNATDALAKANDIPDALLKRIRARLEKEHGNHQEE